MIKGIDVSYHQKAIDWEQVKNSGIEFAIIRAGYGKDTVDKQFKANIEGCIKHGIAVGIYWFIYGVNETEALQNANKCHSVIAPYKDKITMKVWCDLEYDTDKNATKRGVTLTKQVRTNMVVAFCERMKYYGYEVGNYANPDYLRNKFYDLPQYPLWLAKYSSSKGDYDCYMWQYSSKGSVPGIAGNVDMNYLYGDIPAKEEVKAESEEYNMPTLTLGSKGKAVKVWQIIIGVKSDGIFGKDTLKATKDWQSKHGLTADGIVGKKSWKAGLESL